MLFLLILTALLSSTFFPGSNQTHLTTKINSVPNERERALSFFTDQLCAPPASLHDARSADTVEATYSQGETTTYQCRTGKDTATATCLSNGQWSPVGYVCGGKGQTTVNK